MGSRHYVRMVAALIGFVVLTGCGSTDEPDGHDLTAATHADSVLGGQPSKDATRGLSGQQGSTEGPGGGAEGIDEGAAAGDDASCPFTRESVIGVVGPIEEWDSEPDGCTVDGEAGTAHATKTMAAMQTIRESYLENLPARTDLDARLYDVSVCEHCTVVDAPSLHVEAAVRVGDQGWLIRVYATTDGDGLELTQNLLEIIFDEPVSLTELAAGSIGGCDDASAYAADIRAAWTDMFAGHESWVDAPGFEDVARPVIDDIVDECGTDFAMEVIAHLSVVGDTWQLLTAWVDG